MLTWNWRRLLVSCAALCVLLLFFFPLVHGPFSATHGPLTAFRGRKALLVLLVLALSLCKAAHFRLKIAPELCGHAPRGGDGGFADFLSGAKNAILRC